MSCRSVFADVNLLLTYSLMPKLYHVIIKYGKLTFCKHHFINTCRIIMIV